MFGHGHLGSGNTVHGGQQNIVLFCLSCSCMFTGNAVGSTNQSGIKYINFRWLSKPYHKNLIFPCKFEVIFNFRFNSLVSCCTDRGFIFLQINLNLLRLSQTSDASRWLNVISCGFVWCSRNTDQNAQYGPLRIAHFALYFWEPKQNATPIKNNLFGSGVTFQKTLQ